MPRIFAIGDIHGHLSVLDRLLERIPLSPEDTLVFLGDYVDRGPDSRGVIERLIQLKEERGDRCVCLLGNHEDMMLDHWRETRGGWIASPRIQKTLRHVTRYGAGFWLSNGGTQTLASYESEEQLEEHIEIIAGMHVKYEQDGYTFVHAGIRPSGHTARAEMLWGAPGFFGDLDQQIRESNLELTSRIGSKIIVGHKVFEQPLVGSNFVAIDTGCAYGGHLTAVQLPEVVFHQESSRN